MANEDKGSNDIELVWAIVDSGTRRLMGRIAPLTFCEEGGLKFRRDVTPCTVHDAVQLHAAPTLIAIPVQTPRGVQMQLQEVYQPSCAPIDGEDAAVDIDVLHIANIRLFSEMQDKGARYIVMYNHLLAALLEARAQRAGIVPAQSIPKETIKLVP